jgi:VRR-NUC domain
MKESDPQKQIIDLLKLKRYVVFKHRNVGIFRKDTGSYIPLAFGEKGISGIIACSPKGIFTAIEIKRPGGKVSTEQRGFIESVKRNKGVAFVAYSLDDAITKDL